MPGSHRRFLEHVSTVANIRDYVEGRRSDRALCVAFDACLAMLRAFRDKHIQMVSRYIIIKSRESRAHSRSISPRAAPKPINIAAASTSNAHQARKNGKPGSQRLRGTGGTALIPFLKQARDETGEPAIDAWARRLLSNGGGDVARLSKLDEHADGEVEVVGLAGTWAMDDSEGGLCHW
jgi:indoleamine 2,3-dioxygenase